MRRPLLFLFILVLSLAAVFGLRHWQGNEAMAIFWYDLQHDNQPFSSTTEITKWLEGIPQLSWAELPGDFRAASGFREKPFLAIAQERSFYRFTQAHFYQKIAGNNRLCDLLPNDTYYRNAVWKSESAIYALLDQRVLFKLLELQERLNALGYDPTAFWIRSGPRYPSYNKQVGGASRSRHLYGEALDLRIGDINQDGRYTEEDKKIVLRILDLEVIKHFGGVGRYQGTRAVHMDVRGYKARWDDY